MKMLRGLEVPQARRNHGDLSDDTRSVLDYLEQVPSGAKVDLHKVFPAGQPFSTKRRKAALAQLNSLGYTVQCWRGDDPSKRALVFYAVPRKRVLFPEDQPDRPARYWPQGVVGTVAAEGPVRVPVASVRRWRARRDRALGVAMPSAPAEVVRVGLPFQ